MYADDVLGGIMGGREMIFYIQMQQGSRQIPTILLEQQFKSELKQKLLFAFC